MTEWGIWLILAGALVILELFSGTFYLLMVAIGMLAGALAAFSGVPDALQLLVAAVVAAIATYALRKSRFGKLEKLSAASDPNVNLDIGQQLEVKSWHEATINSRPMARAMYRGAHWDIELAAGGVAQPGIFVIKEVRGSRLIVTNNSEGEA